MRWFWQRRPIIPRAIALNSFCPACGHAGCTLRCIPAGITYVGEKQIEKPTVPMVERTCMTCGAKCYEKTVLDPEKWNPK